MHIGGTGSYVRNKPHNLKVPNGTKIMKSKSKFYPKCKWKAEGLELHFG